MQIVKEMEWVAGDMGPVAAPHDGRKGHLGQVEQLLLDRAHESVEGILRVAREELGMDLTYLAEFKQGKQVFRSLVGEKGSFGMGEGRSIELEQTYCQRMVDGRIPNIVRDTRADARVKDLAVTQEADLGAYIGVPVVLSNGKVYGSLCGLSHESKDSLDAYDVRFLQVLSRIIADQLERQELEAMNQRLQVEAAGVDALVAALEARDGYTGNHSQAVVELSRAVAQRLRLSAEEVAEVEQTALLHDIGKIGVPDSILNKQGPLTESEWQLMRQHPVIGARIVASIESLAHLVPAIRAEHERWDGRGYPDGLAGEEIPLASCIGFACDAYHAMVSDRPYRAAIGHEAAMEELRRNAGTQFCPDTIQALLEVLGDRRGRA
jgi:response regulator RpfG family c-di-GMP phosphodiesterase